MIIINPEAKLFEKAIMSLPLLPAAELLDGYEHIKDLIHDSEIFIYFKGLLNYVESYWLKNQVYQTSIKIISFVIIT